MANSWFHPTAEAQSAAPPATHPHGTHAWLSERKRTDALAPRYSRIVEIMKLVLPITAVALVLLVVSYSMFTRSAKNLSLTFDDLTALGGDRIVSNPTLTFTDEKNRAFVVKATRAKQLEGQTDLWRLDDIRARMNKPAGFGYNLTSPNGVLNTKSNIIDLAGDIDLTSDDGYRFNATTAHVDMSAGEVTSHDAVHGEGPTGSIEAESFVLRDHGQQMSFVGNVHFRARGEPAKGG